MSLVQDYLRLAVELKAEEIVFDSTQRVLFRTGTKTLKQIKSSEKKKNATKKFRIIDLIFK